MALYEHQVKFVQNYTGPNLICHETGTGKTVCACLWLRDGRDENALVICPKKIVGKWLEELRKWDTKATVVSKENFKLMSPAQWSAIIVDEIDEFASPLFVAKQRSQLSTALYKQVKDYPNIPILGLSATPIRSNPWNLHSILTFLGHYIDHKRWRDRFFELQNLPYLPRPAYIPRPDWRQKIRPTLEKYADIVLLKDCVGELPAVTVEQITVKTPKYIKAPDAKPFFDEHRFEQQNKVKEILEIGKGFKKVLVVAYYREQIADLEKQLSKDRQTFAIHGGISNQEAIIKEAQEADECYFIVQSGIGAGFDLNSFSCGIFASMSYAVRDHIQMLGRMRRIHDLHPIHYYHLLAGRCDRAILKNIQAGYDFIPSKWTAESSEDA